MSAYMVTVGLCLACALLANQGTLSPETMATALGVFENVISFFLKHVERNVRDVSGDQIQLEYDFVIVGAGTAGSVVANRLSENPHWKILLLEAGKDETFLTDIPAYAVFATLGDNNWGYKTEPQDHACLAMKDRRCVWPRGKALGGTSTINHMIYSRGSRQDYDEWARLGNTGWSFADVLPYFVKLEEYFNVESSTFHTELGQAFLDAGKELNYTLTPEYHNGSELLGFSHFKKTMRSGVRLSASKAFLKPIRTRKNLDVSLNSLVTKIVIDPGSKQATAVEFLKEGIAYSVKARLEVVLSAGSLNSPKILMHSGVGPRDHLQQLGIPIIQELKVGNNLQDHVGFLGLTFRINKTIGMVPSRMPILKSIVEYVVKGTGPLALSAASESFAFVQTKYATNGRPDIELLFAGWSLNSLNSGNLMQTNLGIAPEFYENVYRSLENTDVWTIVPILLHPKTRGTVRLCNKDPLNPPLFDPKALSDRQDLKTLVEGIKIAIELASTMAFQKYGSTLHNISVPGCRDNIFNSDAYWECASQYLSTGMYHQVGTCKMGPASDPDAVVDPRLRVFGVERLRVADASIIPLEVTGHTMAAAYMIGEKVSDLLKKDWAPADIQYANELQSEEICNTSNGSCRDT